MKKATIILLVGLWAVLFATCTGDSSGSITGEYSFPEDDSLGMLSGLKAEVKRQDGEMFFTLYDGQESVDVPMIEKDDEYVMQILLFSLVVEKTPSRDGLHGYIYVSEDEQIDVVLRKQ